MLHAGLKKLISTQEICSLINSYIWISGSNQARSQARIGPSRINSLRCRATRDARTEARCFHSETAATRLPAIMPSCGT